VKRLIEMSTVKYTLTGRVAGDTILWTCNYSGSVITKDQNMSKAMQALSLHVPGSLWIDSNIFEGEVEDKGHIYKVTSYKKAGFSVTDDQGHVINTGYPVKQFSWTSDSKVGEFVGSASFRIGNLVDENEVRSKVRSKVGNDVGNEAVKNVAVNDSSDDETGGAGIWNDEDY